jgi:hypothetical protein
MYTPIYLFVAITICEYKLDNNKTIIVKLYVTILHTTLIQVAYNHYLPRSVANIFENWLHGIDNRFRTLIRVGAFAVIWSLWLCKNDKVFNDKISSLLQVIYQCTGTLCLWSSLQRVEHHSLFTEVCARLEILARDTFFRHGWQHNLRIEPPPS